MRGKAFARTSVQSRRSWYCNIQNAILFFDKWKAGAQLNAALNAKHRGIKGN